MAYTAADVSKPTTANTREEVVNFARTNAAALRDMIAGGGDGSGAWAFAQSGGTAAAPTTITLSKGAERIRWSLTYTGNQVTAITCAYSSDSGSNYDTIGSFTFGFDASTFGNVTSGNVGSVLLARAMQVWAFVRDLYASFTSHTGTTVGSGAHGAGSIASQNANAVAVTGGTINGASVGATTPAMGYFVGAREVHAAVAFGGASTNLDLAAAGSFAFTATGSGAAALTFSNPPPNNRATTIYLFLTNGGLRTWTWPTGSKWAGGSPPSLSSSGLDVLTATTVDGGTSWHWTLASRASA